MIVLYILGGIFFLGLSIFFIDKREKLSHSIKTYKNKRVEIEDMNRQLDELQAQLDEIQEPLMKVNDYSKKTLKFFSK